MVRGRLLQLVHRGPKASRQALNSMYSRGLSSMSSRVLSSMSSRGLSSMASIPTVAEGTFPREVGPGRGPHLYSTAWHARLGPIFQERVGGATLLFLACPHLTRQVFAQEGR